MDSCPQIHVDICHRPSASCIRGSDSGKHLSWCMERCDHPAWPPPQTIPTWTVPPCCWADTIQAEQTGMGTVPLEGRVSHCQPVTMDDSTIAVETRGSDEAQLLSPLATRKEVSKAATVCSSLAAGKQKNRVSSTQH